MRHFFSVLDTISGILSFTIFITLFIELIILLSDSNQQLFYTLHYYIFILFLFDIICRVFLLHSKKNFKKHVVFFILILIPLLNYHGISFLPEHLSFTVQQLILLIISLSRIKHMGFLFEPFRHNPTQSFIGGFILFILIGAILLITPAANHENLSFLDALFTSTSAICVTGLSTIDIGNNLTPFGQLILMALIQIGGLGIMSFYALITISLNQRFLSTESREFQEGWATDNIKETSHLIKSIFLFTILFESIGACLIFIQLPINIGDFGTRVFYAAFHSISAFCNAGFSLFSDSLSIFSDSILSITIFSTLIIIGGIGFPVIFELYNYFITKQRPCLRLQTKIVLWMSFTLILLGTLIFFIFPLTNTSSTQSISTAFFHSISARTAGFSTIDFNHYTSPVLWFLLILMFIGASPGSTGGGIKTTTFGLLILALLTTIRSQDKVHLFGRFVHTRVIFKALAIFIMSLFIISTSFFILLITENIDFFPLIFETVSAFATVGFSLGATEELSTIGKTIIIFLMLFGRIGPLTLAFALTRRTKTIKYQFPEERVLLG